MRGFLRLNQGDNTVARERAEIALRLAKPLAQGNPLNSDLQETLLYSVFEWGDVQKAENDSKSAIASFSEASKIGQALAAKDSTNTKWQRVLFVITGRAGDTLWVLRDRTEALAKYHECMAIAQSLATKDLANTEWQEDLELMNPLIFDQLEIV